MEEISSFVPVNKLSPTPLLFPSMPFILIISGAMLLILTTLRISNMRKIDAQLVSAIRSENNRFHKGNRCVDVSKTDDGQTVIDVKFHGHRIASITDKTMMLDNCGYWTNTTKQILNVLLGEFCGSCLYQRNFDWFIGDGTEYTGGQMLVPMI